MKRAARIVLAFALALGATPAFAQSIFEVVKTGTPDQVRALAAKDASGNTPLHQAAISESVPRAEPASTGHVSVIARRGSSQADGCPH